MQADFFCIVVHRIKNSEIFNFDLEIFRVDCHCTSNPEIISRYMRHGLWYIRTDPTSHDGALAHATP